jgi:hypothetical protein
MAYADVIVVDASGNVFVSGYSGQLLEEALSNGEYSQSTIAQVSGPLAMDGGGNLYVAKGNSSRRHFPTGHTRRASSTRPVTGLPAGATVTFSPSTVAASGGTTDVTLK